MGANFCTMSLPGDMSQTEIKKRFREAQEEDRYENGHSYSGGFGMASGLSLHNDQPVLPDAKAADDWLADNCVKWEHARGVRHNTLDGKVMWMIGAWCSS